MDADAADVIKLLLEGGPTNLQHDLEDWKPEPFEGKNVLFYRGKNYIPKDQGLRKEIVQKYHDSPTAGHPGELETFNTIK